MYIHAHFSINIDLCRFQIFTHQLWSFGRQGPAESASQRGGASALHSGGTARRQDIKRFITCSSMSTPQERLWVLSLRPYLIIFFNGSSRDLHQPAMHRQRLLCSCHIQRQLPITQVGGSLVVILLNMHLGYCARPQSLSLDFSCPCPLSGLCVGGREEGHASLLSQVPKDAVTFLLHHYDLQDRVLSASEREKVEMGLLRLWRESGLIVAPA